MGVVLVQSAGKAVSWLVVCCKMRPVHWHRPFIKETQPLECARALVHQPLPCPGAAKGASATLLLR